MECSGLRQICSYFSINDPHHAARYHQGHFIAESRPFGRIRDGGPLRQLPDDVQVPPDARKCIDVLTTKKLFRQLWLLTLFQLQVQSLHTSRRTPTKSQQSVQQAKESSSGYPRHFESRVLITPLRQGKSRTLHRLRDCSAFSVWIISTTIIEVFVCRRPLRSIVNASCVQASCPRQEG